jgi:hypothetical protein
VEPPFTSLVGEIEAAYERLGHQLGWRFLYSPARTLTPGIRLATVGTNPGGRKYEPPSSSVEEGNAYRYVVETWPGGSAHGPNPLQQQIGLLYRELARRLPGASPGQLMDDTLAANFCPFRSPSWGSLPRRAESIEFSRHLWRRILQVASPSALICLGKLPADELGATLVSVGARLVEGPEVGEVGWGAATYELSLYESPSARTLLVRVPHPSRFAIFGRAASQPAVDRITRVLATAMAGGAEQLGSPAAPRPPVTHTRRESAPTNTSTQKPITAVRDEAGRYPQPTALLPKVPPRDVQWQHRIRGEALVVSCSARAELGRAITWIVLDPDGSYSVDGPDEFGFPLRGVNGFGAALDFARHGVRRQQA